ncbi:AIS_HP2_G0041100.mRNA.1.CDS.1 [Saccharomyces cerevisiae]|nr:AIS_HP2_G0041100.mRNA.1.CDS.1 [Saccharomyces cerevisiae]CAI6701806.1 AIS_HP2_G0041100.mRNA.1.CDS.1 [Saccharomyces cerevisiae]
MEIENEKICTCIAQILHLLNSLIITFLDDDKTETGQSFVYIDGFLVKKHNNQHTIVNFETYKNKMKVSDRRKFEKANFDEFESALNNKNDLVHCPSITLFESIPTEVRSFYEDEKSGLIKVVKFRTGAMDRKRSFEKIVVSVMVGKNVQKFLTFVEDEPDFQGGPIPSKYLIPKKINLMVYTLFQVHTLKFNRKDYDTLSLFYLNRGYYNELSFPATTTASINVRTSATTTESTNSNTNATTTESTNSSTNATTTASINVRTSATTTESTNSSTNATTTASINVRTSATTTESTNSSTNATTTEGTNSNTSATTTESTDSNTSATTTESTDSNTSATTTASTNSSTNATTTASTNSSTNATTTESTNASAKEDANKDGNAEDNRFHPVTDINKEPYKRKGSQMVLLERKKLKAQFPNTSENMNVLQFLGFRSDEIKHLFLYGIDVYFCPEGVFTQYGLCKGCQKMFELCVCWAGQKVSYRRMAWEALAVERMLRNDEEYKEYLEDIEPYHGDPVGYLKYFSVKRGEIYSQIQRNYAWYLAITRRRETISVLDSTRGKQGSQVFRMSGRQIKELYYKVWSNLRESKTEVLQYFLNWDEKKCREEWEAKDDTVFVEALEKVGVFQRLRSMTSAGLQGPQYVKLQFSRHHRQLRSRYELSLGMHLRDQLALGVTPSKVPHWTAFLSMLIGLFYNKTFRQKLEYLLEQISEVWLLPHWVDLANVEVLAADNTRVPLYMLMVAVHKELDSDDVPDGRFDIILLCRDSSREVGE